MCSIFLYRYTRIYLYVNDFVNFSRTLCHAAIAVTIYIYVRACVCVKMFTVLQLFRATSIRLVCLRSYRSYIRPRLKFNAIKPREMSAVEGISVAPFQTPKLHSYGVYSAETFYGFTTFPAVRRQCNGLRVRDIHGGA